MLNQWPTQEQDMYMVDSIIEEHQKMHGDEPLSIFHIIVDVKEKKLKEVQLAPWVMEMAECFRNQYGYEHGQAVASLVINKIMLQHETIH